MRFARVLVVLGVGGALALGGGIVVGSSVWKPNPLRTAATTGRSSNKPRAVAVPPFLRVIPVPHAVPPFGGAQPCFVNGCSETPCVIPVHGGAVTVGVSAVPAAIAEAVVARPAGPIIRQIRPTVRQVSPTFIPGSACPHGNGVPRILRVVGR